MLVIFTLDIKIYNIISKKLYLDIIIDFQHLETRGEREREEEEKEVLTVAATIADDISEVRASYW